MKVIQFQDKL